MLHFSITQLKMACHRISQSLGCNTEGIAPETVRELLCCRVAKLVQDHNQSVKEVWGTGIKPCISYAWVSMPFLALQTTNYKCDLEASSAELAATNVKVSSITSQLEGLRSSLATKDAQIHQLKVGH